MAISKKLTGIADESLGEASISIGEADYSHIPGFGGFKSRDS